LPGNHSKAEHVVKKNKVGFLDEDDNFQLFEITRVEEEHSDTQEKKVYARHIFYELKDAERIGDVRPTDDTATQALTSALDGTNWTVGAVADLGLNSTSFYRLNPLSAIHDVVNTWGGELRFRIVTVDNAVTGRFVDLLNRRGSETGHAFEYGRNVESITKTEYTGDTKTAMYGYGKGEKSGTGFTRRITFEDIVWTVAGGDPVDKPVGQKWVGDPGALTNNGRVVNDQRVHRFGDFEDSEEENKEILLDKTWDALQKAKEIPTNYKMKAVDMEHLVNEFGESMDHTAVRLGDTNFAIDNEYNPVMQFTVRVIKVKNYLGEPERRELEHGNFLPLFTNDSEFERIKAKVNNQSGVWDDTTVTDSDFPDTTPEVPVNFSATGLFRTVQLKWEYDTSSFIAAYEVYASTIASFTPDHGNLVFRGKTGGFVHEGETNTTYYFRVRSINHQGTASAYTNEVSVSTVRITEADITPEVITNSLIAANAAIDFAKIANVEITDALISGTLSANLIRAGILESESGETQFNLDDGTFSLADGKLKFDGTTLNTEGQIEFTDSGAVVAWISGQNLYIKNVQVTEGAVIGNHKIEKYNADITLVKWVGEG